jgi:hypothetical protein
MAAVGKGFSGDCAGQFLNYADIPVRPGKLTLKVTIPKATRFMAVVISTPRKTG